MILLAEAAIVDPDAVAESEAGWLLMGCCGWFQLQHKGRNIVGSVCVCYTPFHDAADESAVLMSDAIVVAAR